jgi:hypothetical protein
MWCQLKWVRPQIVNYYLLHVDNEKWTVNCWEGGALMYNSSSAAICPWIVPIDFSELYTLHRTVS